MIKNIFWNINVLENQLLDQLYAILSNNKDIKIFIMPRFIDRNEFKKHKLSQIDNFVLIDCVLKSNYKIYLIKLFIHLTFKKYDLIDTKMAQSKESYICYLTSKQYLVNMYGSERNILDNSMTDSLKRKTVKVLKKSIFHICNDKTLIKTSQYVGCTNNYLLYNAMHLSRFLNIYKEYNEVPIIFFNHRLIRFKRPIVFFESLKILKDKGLSFKVIVVGPKRLESDLGQEVSKFIQNNNLDSYIEWIDQRVDGNTMDTLYARSDITVNMSELIVPSLATLEAMATKIAPIIADEIDSDKYVENGVNGFVIKPRSKLLAEKLEILINDRDLREEFGKKSQERVEKYFDINKWGKIYGDIYRHILNNGPLPKPFLEYES